MGLYGQAPDVAQVLWIAMFSILAFVLVYSAAQHLRHVQRVKHWRQWTPSEWWMAIGSDERFTPVGDRETMAYASAFRDAMRMINDLRWDRNDPAEMKVVVKEIQIELHRRAMLFERGKIPCPHGHMDWDDCGDCCH